MVSNRQCSRCKHKKPASEFYRDKRRPGGLSSICKECQSAYSQNWQRRNKAKMRAIQQKFFDRNPGYAAKAAKRLRVKKQYGLSLEEYEVLTTDAHCAICGNAVEKPHLDHCHVSGKIRGVLCSGCNLGLGHFRDDPEILRKAIKYLKRN